MDHGEGHFVAQISGIVDPSPNGTFVKRLLAVSYSELIQ